MVLPSGFGMEKSGALSPIFNCGDATKWECAAIIKIAEYAIINMLSLNFTIQI